MSTREPAEAVIGLDIGGTSTTAAMLGEDRVISWVDGPGANPRSSGGDLPAQLADVLSSVVSGADAETAECRIAACVAGMAGGGPAGRDQAQSLLIEAAQRAGIAPEVIEVRADPDVAFAAGSASPEGILLLAGTGAIACRYVGFEQIGRADGLGWLLGDVGGGVWLALEGLRAAAAALDGRGPGTSLVEPALMLAEEAGGRTGDARQDLVRLAGQRSPAELGAFARTVTEHSAAGDAVAEEILARGVDGLLRSLQAVDDGGHPVVLAGSLLTAAGPVRDRVRSALAGRHRDAVHPVLGALRLAAVRASWAPPEPEALEAAGTEGMTKTPEATGAHGEARLQTRRTGVVVPQPSAPAARRETGLTVDAFRAEDTEGLYEICLRTGDSGEDASALYRDGDLLGHVYLGAYLRSAPELARVLRRPDGVPVGYCVATADTAGFEDWCERVWWPPLRERYPEPEEADDSPDARLIRTIRRPGHTEASWLAELPAHLHIDLLPEAQGAGNGARLFRATLEALTEVGAPGVHLGVGGRNARAIGFYEHMGLRTVEHLSWGLTMGARLPLRPR